MSAKAPHDRTRMLSVIGVGEAKYDKYGERFIRAIALFMNENPDTVTSMASDEDVPEENLRFGRKRKNHKEPFCLNPKDGDQFQYGDLYRLSEIKDELNRITTADYVKHIFGTDIYRLLVWMEIGNRTGKNLTILHCATIMN